MDGFGREEKLGEEEITIKDLVLESKDIDLSILESYKEMPEEFRNSLSFNEYYSYYRRKINLTLSDINEESEKRGEEVPEEIKIITAENLAKELINFIKLEFPDDERVWIRNISQLFWNQKSLRKFDMPPEIQLKIEKAEMLAQKQIDNEKEVKEKERVEKEKKDLPNLIESCITWARNQSLKKVTLIDIDAFLSEQDTEILQQTKRALYSMVNSKIKR